MILTEPEAVAARVLAGARAGRPARWCRWPRGAGRWEVTERHGAADVAAERRAALTVQELERHHLEQAVARLSARGLPVVRGELADEEPASYHFFPGRDQAVDWLA